MTVVRWHSVVLAALAGGGVLAGCLVWLANDAWPAGVETAVVARGSVVDRVVLAGIVGWRDPTPVAVEGLGRVLSVEVAPGQRVEKGEVLVRLDDRRARMQVRRRRLDLERAQIRAGRTAVDHAPTHDPDARVLAELDVAQARLELEDAEHALGIQTVRSPITGVVLQASLSPGDTLSASAPPAIVIGEAGRLGIEIEGDELEMAGVKPGLAALVFAMRGGGQPIPARVSSVPVPRRARMGGSAGAVFSCALELVGQPHGLEPGGSVRVELDRSRVDGVAVVPLRAIFSDQQGPRVLTVQGNTVTARPVQLGMSDLTVAEVRGGLDVGATILLGSPATLEAVWATRSR